VHAGEKCLPGSVTHKVQEMSSNHKHKHAAVPTKLRMKPDVYADIRETIGMQKAETGGILGGCRKSGEVTHYYFDGQACEQTDVAYTPNNALLNSVLKTQWIPQGIDYLGSIHSHPPFYEHPSAGDEMYALRILDTLDLPYLLTPIVTTVPDTGSFSLFPYTISRNVTGISIIAQELVVGGKTITVAKRDAAMPPESIPWELLAVLSGAGLLTVGIATAHLIKYIRQYQKDEERNRT